MDIKNELIYLAKIWISKYKQTSNKNTFLITIINLNRGCYKQAQTYIQLHSTHLSYKQQLNHSAKLKYYNFIENILNNKQKNTIHVEDIASAIVYSKKLIDKLHEDYKHLLTPINTDEEEMTYVIENRIFPHYVVYCALQCFFEE